jgi:DNA-binding CsgD family transcriptional regulator/tetratricopeptide (TPR) repeat protein
VAHLVGREGELSQALAILRQTARRGDGAIVLVTGEAGIGKTVFMRSVAERAVPTGYAVGIGKAEEIGQIAPGAPLLIALRSGSHPLLSANEFGALAPLHSEPLWLIDRIADLLDQHSQQAPVLIAIDDYQWADPLSRFAVRTLAGRMVGLPVVWLLASRGDASELAADLSMGTVEQVTVRRIHLTPLGEEDIDAVAARILGVAPTGETRRRLRGVDGNPFLAVQLAEAVALASADGASDTMLPATLVAAVGSRLYRISPSAQTLVHLVAVWGRPLGVRDAAALLEPDSAGDLSTWIAEGVAADLLVSPGHQVAIRHDLIRESVYTGMPGAVRVALHRQCAEYLLATGHELVEVAPHMQESASIGDERAVSVLADTAEESVAAMPEVAARLMGQAFALLPTGHPRWLEVGERYADILGQAQHAGEVITVVDTLLARTTDPGLRARLQVIAARALWLAGAPAKIIDRVGTASSEPGIPAGLRARLAGFRALAATRTGTAEAASRAAQSVLAEAHRLDDRLAEQVALQALGEIARNELRHEDALSRFRALRRNGADQYLAQETAALRLLDRFDEAQDVIDAAERTADGRRETVDPALAEAHMWQDFMLGRFDEAEAGARTLARLSDELGTSTHRLETAMVLSLTAIIRGDPAAARDHLDRAERDDRSDDIVRIPRLRLCRSLLAGLDGNPEEGVRIVKPVMSRASSTRSYWPRLPEWMRVHTGLAVAAGDADFAHESVARAATAAERNPGSASLAGIALQVRGLASSDAGLLAQAVDRLEDSPRFMLLASALTDYGSALLARGDHSAGVVALERALAAYGAHGAARPAASVARKLQVAGVSTSPTVVTPRPTKGWAALTAAELAVAELISSGHTNRLAARALGISPNTVSTHLRSIFAKLDVQSRVQLANSWNSRG